jgi:uncharacterized repeat protein (TIGR01451 family)
MNTLRFPIKTASLALVAVCGLAALPQAHAAGTLANTSIDNRATVSYSVGSVAQTPIESSPTGNSTPGAGNGASTSFVVDNRIDLTVTELSGGPTVTSPGATGAVTAFLLTNTGNAAQAFQLSAAQLTGGTVFGNTDNTDVTNPLAVFVDANGNGIYEPGTDTATAVTSLAADASVTVFVVANVPLTVTNGQFASVRLTARAAVDGAPGTLAAETVGAETPGAVDVVFGDGAGVGDAARDGAFGADDQYQIQSAALTIAKTSTVVSDPFNGTSSPRAIPGAVVEYAITMTNTGTVPATGVTLVDPIPANTVFATGGYNAGASDVSVTVGATTTYCVAEAGGTDTNGDGCVRTGGGALSVSTTASSTVATGAGNAVTVRFRVTIN